MVSMRDMPECHSLVTSFYTVSPGVWFAVTREAGFPIGNRFGLVSGVNMPSAIPKF